VHCHDEQLLALFSSLLIKPSTQMDSIALFSRGFNEAYQGLDPF
jgi:hypothetical protein